MNAHVGLLRGKTVLVTGATSGIGAATALELANLGATTIIVGRNRRKCDGATIHIRRASDNTSVYYLQADLSSQSDIRRITEEFKRKFGVLDVLVNNAGANFNYRQLSVDGLEMTFALNHLGYFLLTVLLISALKKSQSGRIINVASAAHERARMNFEDLQGEKHYERLEAYGQSKLANLLFTYELARRLHRTSITANALTPGAVATNIGSNNNWLRAKARNLLNLVLGRMVTPRMGAGTVIYLATSPEVQSVTGCYFKDKKQVVSSAASTDIAAAKRLWTLSEQLTAVDADREISS